MPAAPDHDHDASDNPLRQDPQGDMAAPFASLPSNPAFLQFALARTTLILSESAVGAAVYAQLSLPGQAPAIYLLDSPEFTAHVNAMADQFSNFNLGAYLNSREHAELRDNLRSRAYRLADVRPVFKRIAWLPERRELWIDHARPDGICTKVTAERWTNEVPSQPLFCRSSTQRPSQLPSPSHDGYDSWMAAMPPGMDSINAKLLLGGVLGCFLPPNFSDNNAFPVILISGQAGSGKTTTSKFISKLVDNQAASIASKPNSPEDIYVACQGVHLLSYDNLDGIRGALSDTLCRVTSGSAFTRRKRYTDSVLSVLKAHNPVLLNGIHPDIPGQDLIDRSISISVDRIKTVSSYDPDATRTLDASIPEVMGYICDLLAVGLARYETTTVDNPPRLSLLAKFATACEPFGVDVPYVDLLRNNQRQALVASRDNDLVIAALFEFVSEKREWTGNYRALLDSLNNRADEQTRRAPEWPNSPQGLARFMQQNGLLLDEQGMNVFNGPRRNYGRSVTLSIRPDPDVPF